MAKRYAEVDGSRCVACGECAYACPRKAIAVRGGCYAEVTRETCVGCGLCEKRCPAGCITILQREAVQS